MKVLVIGSVNSTERIIQGLVRNGIKPIGILGYDFNINNKIRPSGYCNLSKIAAELNVPFRPFDSINDKENLDWAKKFEVDLIFAVGFSQLLIPQWFKVSRKGCIGFHPTLLPKGRGRAPLSWLVLEEQQGAASFFLMGAGADDGPIFEQISFEVKEDDSIKSLTEKVLEAIDIALDNWIPKLLRGEWAPEPQNQDTASYYGVRKPKDGIIDWSLSSQQTYRLIKASLTPHPGAFTYFRNSLIEIIDVSNTDCERIKGVVGRVLMKKDKQWFMIQCCDEPLWVKFSLPISRSVKIGSDLTFDFKTEFTKMEERIRNLEDKIIH